MSDRPRDTVERLLELAGPRRAPARDHYDRARQAAHAAWQDEVRRARRTRAARAGAVSLAAAAVLVLAVVAWRHAVAPPAVSPAALPSDVIVGTHNGTPVRLGSVLQTGPATRTALQLANGVEVRLDVNSEIAFDEASAISLAHGGVFIDTGSAIGSNRSIDVRTPLGTARDIGTRFEVRLIDDRPAAPSTSLRAPRATSRGEAGSHSSSGGGRNSSPWLPPSGGRSMRVRVRDGIVRVTTVSGAENGGRGTELVAAAGGGIRRAEAPVTGADWDWVTLAAAPFDLDGKTLAEFLAWVAREGGWDVRFRTDALAAATSTIVISGSVDGLTPERALRAVLATCGLTHRLNGEVVTIEGGGV